jgi:polygalacturonase
MKEKTAFPAPPLNKTIFLFMLIVASLQIQVNGQIPGAYADGKHLDTQAIQAAFDSVAALGTGGIVRFTAGTYLTGPFILKGNNLTVQIDSEATILATTNKNLFAQAGADTTKLLTSTRNFISSSGCNNLTIQGKGTIDGQGSAWWPHLDTIPRPRLMQLNSGTKLEVKEVTLQNSPMFHLCPNSYYDVSIHDIKVLAPASSPNTDGIDPSACHKVRIYNCYVDNGDDNIAIGSSSTSYGTWGAVSTDIVIKHNTFMHGHGVSIGSYTNGGVDSMLVDSCTFNGTTNGVRIKSQRGRGGNVRNITYSNLTMTNVHYPIYFTGYYSDVPDQAVDTLFPVTSTTPNFHDILVKNLKSTNTYANTSAGIIVGVAEKPFTGIRLENVNISSYLGLQVRNAEVYISDTSLISVKSGNKIIREIRSSILTDTTNNGGSTEVSYYLKQNYPNPFNPATKISYYISTPGFVKLEIFSALGQLVRTLVNENQDKGDHTVRFQDKSLPSGVYLYRLLFNNKSTAKKMVMLK